MYVSTRVVTLEITPTSPAENNTFSRYVVPYFPQDYAVVLVFCVHYYRNLKPCPPNFPGFWKKSLLPGSDSNIFTLPTTTPLRELPACSSAELRLYADRILLVLLRWSLFFRLHYAWPSFLCTCFHLPVLCCALSRRACIYAWNSSTNSKNPALPDGNLFNTWTHEYYQICEESFPVFPFTNISPIRSLFFPATWFIPRHSTFTPVFYPLVF